MQKDSSHTLREHGPEYLMEAGLLGPHMMATGIFAVALQASVSPIQGWIKSSLFRRLLYGMALGATSVALVYSPWGRRSGAHANSAITFTNWRLGKVGTSDALFYIVAQLFGGVSGVIITPLLLGNRFRLPPLRYVTTQPGAEGVCWALGAEFLMSFVLMSTILFVTNRPLISNYTAWFTGLLVALFLTFEAPLSGMSMNPARTFASAFPG